MQAKKKKTKKNMLRTRKVRAIQKREHHYPTHEDEDPSSPKLPQHKISKRWLRKILFAIATTMAVLCLIFVLVTGYVAIVFDGERVKKELSELVAEHTSGRLEIEESEFSIWSGFNFRNIRLIPDKDKKYENHPLFAADRIELRYNLWKLFLLTIDIGTANIEAPRIKIYNIGAESNINHFLPKSSPPPAAEAQKSSKSTSILFIPLRGLAENIGFTNLDFFISPRNIDEMREEYIHLYNVSLNARMDWLFFRSDGLIHLHSPDDHLTYVKVESPNQDSLLLAKIKLDNKLMLKDFSQIKIHLQNQIQELRFQKYDLRNIPLSFISAFKLGRDFQSIDIDNLDFDIAGAITTNTRGKITLLNHLTGAVLVDTKSDLEINLKPLEPYVHYIVPDLSMKGLISIEKAVISGKVSTKDKNDYDLPNAAVLASFKDIHIASDKLGINLQGLTKRTEINLSHSLLDNSIQLNLGNVMSIDKIAAHTQAEDDHLQTEMQKFSSTLNVQAHLPNLTIPSLQVQLHAEKIQAKSQQLGRVEAPLDLRTHISTTKDFVDISTSGQLEFGDIADAHWLIQCESKCEKIRANSQLSLTSLSKILAIAKPLLHKTLEQKDMVPKSMGGSLKFKLATKGHIPHQKTKNKDDLIGLSDLNIDTQVQLQKMNLNMPFMKFAMSGFDVDLNVSGDLMSQIIKGDITLPNLSITPDGFKEKVNTQNFSHKFEIVNSLNEKWTPQKQLEKFTTDLQMTTSIGRVDIKEFLPVPLESTRIDLSLNQKNLHHVHLQNLEIMAPSLGIHKKNTTTVTLNKDLKPQSFETKGSLSSDKDLSKTEIAQIKTSGRFFADYEVTSPDLDKFNIESQLNFDHFSIDLPEESSQKSKIKVSDLHGHLPFKQNITLSLAQKKLEESGLMAKKSSSPSTSKTEKTVEEVSNDQEIIVSQLEEYRKRDRITRNLVENVDYGNIKPYYKDNHRITIKEIMVPGLRTHDLVFDFEITENEIKLKNYSLFLLGGALQGKMNLLMEILPIEFSTSMHFTNLNASRLYDDIPELKRKAKELGSEAGPKIDGTIHFKYDFLSEAMNGNLDITSIGKDQLRLLLYYLDPEEKNPNISTIRKALVVGDLKLVKVPITNGEIGLDLDLRLLGAPIPLPEIRRFPVAQIVRNFQTSEKKSNVGEDNL